MGKASRRKRQRIKRIYKRPDNAIRYGSIRIERFGRFIRYRNESTPAQHAKFLKQLRESHDTTKGDLEREVAGLQQLVLRYDPIELMHGAAYMVLPLFIEHKSENEYRGEENYFLPTLEYLQYLISRSEPNADGRKPTEAEFSELWRQGVKTLAAGMSGSS